MTHPQASQALLVQLGFADPVAALRLPLPPAPALRIALGARLAARGGTVQDTPLGLASFHPVGSSLAAALVQTVIELLTEGTQGLAEDTPAVALRGLVIGIGSDTEVARAEALERALAVMPLLRDHGLLLSRDVQESLPALLRDHTRLAAPPSLVDAQPRFRDLFELDWQLIDVRLAEIDRIAVDEAPRPAVDLTPPPLEARLALSHGQTELELTPGDCPLLLGRDKSCGLKLDGDVASRIHARIEFDQGRFYFVDDSRNGSYLLTPHGDDVFVHRSRLPLLGRGVISPGATLVKQTGELVHYRCLADTDYGAAVESSSFASV